MKSAQQVTLALAVVAIACTDAPPNDPLAPNGPALSASTTGEISSTFGFRKAITVANIRNHQAALQAIADNNGGDRASWKAGHAATAAYVQQAMIAAGYQVSLQAFSIDVTVDNSPPILNIITPTPQTLTPGTDFATMEYSGSGDVTGNVVPIDVTLSRIVGGSTSGCEASDFAGFVPGSIALLERGTCTFAQKVVNAAAAGAAAAIIFNDGAAGRTDFDFGTLSSPQKPIPTVAATYAIGEALTLTPSTARVKVDYFAATLNSSNVIAESPLGDPNEVVVVGASLDSDVGSPGINSASGAAAQLEVARVFARERSPRNRMRFIWFGGYWEGIVGSRHYVASLSNTDRSRIRSMLNIAPIGSPNFVHFVFDGDNSDFAPGSGVVAGPSGSAEIETIIGDYLDNTLTARAPAGLGVGLDLAPFAEAGIPVGGIYSGQAGIKTAEQAATFGGTAGIAHDPCTRAACDVFANVATSALDTMSDAAAHVTLLLSKKNFTKAP
jgi:Zn-dependent M28 family amino/carboxypeptidase